MIFDSHNALSWQQYIARTKHFLDMAKSGKRVILDLTEKRQRTLDQNAYLHVIIRYLAIQLGYSEEHTKTAFFKLAANYETFFQGYETDEYTNHRTLRLRHTSELTKEELSVCIDRFIYWSAETTGTILPPPDNKAFVNECALEVEKNKRYL